MSIQQSIAHGVTQLGVVLPEQGAARLAAYLTLLERWNRTYNLTAVRDPEAMVIRHILDSLAIRPWIGGPQILDVGSGAGLPGIPLAVACPDLTFYLLDSNGKRTRFLTQAVAELQLSNVQIVRSRVEDYRPALLFNSIISRAFATLTDFCCSAGRLCAPSGRLLAMKGAIPNDELAELPNGYQVSAIYPLHVPHLDAERCLVHLNPQSAS